MPKVSIIVRTKDEERWIGHCLSAIHDQAFKDHEVILVDNCSSDHTVAVAQRYGVERIISISDFIPGHALNEGIRASNGEFIVCLSAHCIPTGQYWLSNLLRNFEDEKIAGVYGKQLPLSFTDPSDTRDLVTVFGDDRRVQIKDYFFHNANSMLRRSVWDLYPFDETVSNIEDRVWGKAVTNAGLHLVYEPDAAVFHHHGLHHGNKPERARGVVSIINRLDESLAANLPKTMEPQNVPVAAVIPISAKKISDPHQDLLLSETIDSLKSAKYIDKIYVITFDQELGKRYGVESIDRRAIPDEDTSSLDHIVKHALIEIEKTQFFPDRIVSVNHDYEERPIDFLDELISEAQYKGLDTAFAALESYTHIWYENEEGTFGATDRSLGQRSDRSPVYQALYGQGCISSAVNIRRGQLLGGKIGILPLNDPRFQKRYISFLDNNEIVVRRSEAHA